MIRKSTIVMTVLFLLMSFVTPLQVNAEGESASEVALSVSASTGADTSIVLNRSYGSFQTYHAGESLTVSSDTPFVGMYIEWYHIPSAWTCTTSSEELAYGQYGFLHEYVDLKSEQTSVTMTFSSDVDLANIYAYTAGTLPAEVEVWEPSCEAADLLAFSSHADDEILWLGGALATYAGERGLRTQVVYLNNYWNGEIVREHEKLDGLWAAGVRNYPVNAPYDDWYAGSIEAAEALYEPSGVQAWCTEMVRRFKPQVVLTQDFGGEYGHGTHQLLARSVSEAVDHSMEADFNPDSAAAYGTWDVPKAYFHLYDQNQIKLDLHQPLSAFGGLDAVQVAQNAYLKHVSQQWCWFRVSDDPSDPKIDQIDCSRFGLYRSTVGEDTSNDMFEHITSYEEQERIEAEKKAAEEKAAQEAAEKKAAEEKAAAEEAARKEKQQKILIGCAAGLAAVIVLLVALIIRNRRIRRRKRRRRR